MIRNVLAHCIDTLYTRRYVNVKGGGLYFVRSGKNTPIFGLYAQQ